MLDVQYLIVHCSATPPTADIGAAEIDAWHRGQGWSGIGYHYVIRRSGAIEPGRPEDEAGAHCKGYNAISLGACLVGGIDDAGKPEANFTEAQWVSLKSLLMTLSAKYPMAEVRGHRDFTNKACPCFNAAAWWTQNH